MPGYNYFGPGTKTVTNIIKGYQPTDVYDEIALHHDLDYMIATTELEMDRANKRAQNYFNSAYLNGGDPTIGNIGYYGMDMAPQKPTGSKDNEVILQYLLELHDKQVEDYVIDRKFTNVRGNNIKSDIKQMHQFIRNNPAVS